MAQTNKTESVDELLNKLNHPLIEDVQFVRGIIKAVDSDISEEWKWNAPSFSYKGSYLVTFNLWEKERIHLVFHNPEIVNIDSEILEGDYPTRRMAYFADRHYIEARRGELERVVRELVRLNRKQ
jgi:hypothetical protein